MIEPALDYATSRGEGIGLALVQHALAVLYNGLGRYPDALDAAEQARVDAHAPAGSVVHDKGLA